MYGFKANHPVFHAPIADRYTPAIIMAAWYRKYYFRQSICYSSTSKKMIAIQKIYPPFHANIVFSYNKICTIRMNYLSIVKCSMNQGIFYFRFKGHWYMISVDIIISNRNIAKNVYQWSLHFFVSQNALPALNIVLETIQFWSMVTFVPNNISCHVQALNFR